MEFFEHYCLLDGVFFERGRGLFKRHCLLDGVFFERCRDHLYLRLFNVRILFLLFEHSSLFYRFEGRITGLGLYTCTGSSGGRVIGFIVCIDLVRSVSKL